MQDLTMYKRTEKYIRQNSNTSQEAVKAHLDAKGFQNTERLNDLQVRARLLGKGHADHQCGGRRRQFRRRPNASAQRVRAPAAVSTYPNLRMLRDAVQRGGHRQTPAHDGRRADRQ